MSEAVDADGPVTVADKDEFASIVSQDEDVGISRGAVEELWEIWSFRAENGSDDIVVTVPEWFSTEEFGVRRPVFFAKVEYDADDKKAVLFDDIRLVDVSVLENEVWDQVTITETLDLLDLSDENDYLDESGMDWIPRSLFQIYERSDA